MPLAVTFPILLLFALLATGAWVGLGLMGVGIGSLALFRSLPVEKVLAQTVWNGLNSPELVALPLFILMAELLFRSKFVDGLFSSIEPWVRRLPGGLLHTNVLGCTFFALISGSSAATTSAVGKITITELEKRGYDRSVVMGSLAGAGTLGFLIPPSIIMIIYGVLSQTSVLKLFAAGIIPGALLCLLFMGYLAVRSFFVPAVPLQKDARGGSIWQERFRGLPALLPFLLLMTVLLGSMYGGFASPSEAAAVAVGMTMVIMAFERTLTWKALKDACLGTARTASMLGLIIAAASFLSTAMGYLGLPQAISAQIQALELSPLALVALLLVIYIALGSFLEGMSLIVMTIPIVLPIVLHAGYDKIWFGVFLIVMVEMAQITPPVGMNLFVIQGLTGEKLATIVRSVIPFFLVMLFFVFLLAIFPEIVTFLPNLV
ncbi:TRAP transporter large permease subunit [Aquamicrobium sp. LC103]|uniref:TRAP transporter large permease n=1 Tax=Aquamicrobium sp. LC103 TaxID=1120658 RepID=UPI00063EA1A9|nr:TRAP transporter large permease subunit [Aquamicrobium sp. LC103]TKT76243.1 TRAP transporter large permease subunit [Aquamicrobium sp. LC103]